VFYSSQGGDGCGEGYPLSEDGGCWSMGRGTKFIILASQHTTNATDRPKSRTEVFASLE